jgi:hypothetical protein
MVDVVALGETMVQFNAVTSGPLRYITTFEIYRSGYRIQFHDRFDSDGTICGVDQ